MDKTNSRRCRFALILLTGFLHGCCTSNLINTFGKKTVDTFNPAAVYRSTNSNSFAIEGMRHNSSVDNRPPFHTVMIIPQESLDSVQVRANQALTLEDIESLPIAFTMGLKSKGKLPSGYIKAYDIPSNEIYLKVNERRPYGGVILFLPLALSIDVITAPLQVSFFCLFMQGM